MRTPQYSSPRIRVSCYFYCCYCCCWWYSLKPLMFGQFLVGGPHLAKNLVWMIAQTLKAVLRSYLTYDRDIFAICILPSNFPRKFVSNKLGLSWFKLRSAFQLSTRFESFVWNQVWADLYKAWLQSRSHWLDQLG